ncbi:uncharacterized protein J3R85_002415 [Psidium guajava]|nr:uncharacterized protein J3R85_002415 [Psidium guajava]
MMSTKKLIQMGRKWQKAAAAGRKRMSLRSTNSSATSGNKSKSSCAQKGHFVVYSSDNRRFAISLSYLSNDIIRELFRISEEEFGIPNSGPIRLPIDAPCTEYIFSMIGRGLAKDLQNALLMSITSCSSSCTALDERFSCPRIYVCSC